MDMFSPTWRFLITTYLLRKLVPPLLSVAVDVDYLRRTRWLLLLVLLWLLLRLLLLLFVL